MKDIPAVLNERGYNSAAIQSGHSRANARCSKLRTSILSTLDCPLDVELADVVHSFVAPRAAGLAIALDGRTMSEILRLADNNDRLGVLRRHAEDVVSRVGLTTSSLKKGRLVRTRNWAQLQSSMYLVRFEQFGIHDSDDTSSS